MRESFGEKWTAVERTKPAKKRSGFRSGGLSEKLSKKAEGESGKQKRPRREVKRASGQAKRKRGAAGILF